MDWGIGEGRFGESTNEQRRHKRRHAIAAMRVAAIRETDGGDDGPAEDGADEDEEGVGEGAGLPSCEDC